MNKLTRHNRMAGHWTRALEVRGTSPTLAYYPDFALRSSAGILPAVASASRTRRQARRPPDSRRDGGATKPIVLLLGVDGQRPTGGGRLSTGGGQSTPRVTEPPRQPIC